MLQHALAIILLIWPVIRALHAIVLLPDRIRTDAERLRTSELGCARDALATNLSAHGL